MIVLTKDVKIAAITKLLFDAAPGATFLEQFNEFVVENGGYSSTNNAGLSALGTVLAPYAGATNALIAAAMTSSLDITGADAGVATNYFTAVLDQFGTDKGGAILSIIDNIYALQNDATWGTTAVNFFDSANRGYVYSTNAANNSQDLETLKNGDEVTSTPLTILPDNFFGTSADDLFVGAVQQNKDGSIANALATGDVIDGRGGIDTITATLMNDKTVDAGASFDVNVKTTNVEIVKLEVLDEGVRVDAGNMDSVTQFWSVNSDDSGLYLEDVRLGSKLSVTKDITFGIKDVDYESEFTALFDSASLRNAGTVTSNSQILIEAGYEDTPNDVTQANPVKDLFIKVTFTHDGKTFDSGYLNTSKTNGAYPDTYQGLKDLLDATLDAQGFTSLTVEFGSDITSITTGAGPKPLQVVAKQIFIKDPAGKAFTAVTSAAGAESTDPTSDVASRILTVDPSSATTLIESNLILDNAGRGSTAGDVLIGAMSNSNAGVEKFNVFVDRSSAIESLNTTNGKLQEIVITSLTAKGDLEIGATQSDLRLIDASLFEGANLMLGTTVEATRSNTEGASVGGDAFLVPAEGGTTVVVAPVNNLKTLSANIAANVTFDGSTTEVHGLDTNNTFTYTTGSGKDKVTFNLDGDSVDAFGESFAVSTNSGDDSVNVKMTDGVSQGTMSILKNLSIDTGAGADKVTLDAYGNFSIKTGADSDFVYIDSSNTNGNATKGVWLFGQTTGTQDWDAPTKASSDTRVLYNAKLTLSFAGIESTVSIPTTVTNNYLASQMTINDAIIAAIAANPELKQLISAKLITGTEQLQVTSLVGGEHALAVGIHQPQLIATGVAANDGSNVLISSNDVSALRLGLLASETVTNLSDDLETAEEIATWTNANNWSGSIDKDGLGNNGVYTTQQISHDMARGTSDTGLDMLDTAGTTADMYFDYTISGTDDTAGINFSTINVGAGDNDLVVLHSRDESANVLKIDQTFGKVTVVDFHNPDTDAVIANTEVGNHAIDFTFYLSNKFDKSVNLSGNADSATAVEVTLNLNPAVLVGSAAGNANAVANGVNMLRYDSSVVNTVAFKDLTAADLVANLNGATGAKVVGGFADSTLNAAAFGATLVGVEQRHIVMVENDLNEGEYKVFYLTSTLDAADKTKLVNEATVGKDFDAASATLLGTLDFGASINFQLVGSTAWSTKIKDLITAFNESDTLPNDGVVPPPTPVYTLTSDATSFNEGTNATFIVTTTGTETSLAYTLSGNNNGPADFTAPVPLSVPIVAGRGTITVPLIADKLTDAASETLVVTLVADTAKTVTVAINDTSVPDDGFVNVDVTAAGVTGEAAAEAFKVDVATAMADLAGNNFLPDIISFDLTKDKLVLDLPNADPTITTLAALNFQQGVTVQDDPFAVSVSVNFGEDANGGQVVSVGLVGITPADWDNVQVQVI